MERMEQEIIVLEKNGKNSYIDVPLGTIVKNAETNKIICEITKNDDEHILVKGGSGGRRKFTFQIIYKSDS